MFNKLQRYSIRKLTIGAASVLIGVTFLGIDTEIVHAETTPTSEETITEQNESQSDVEKNNAENHETSDSRKAGGGDTEQNTNNENNKKIEVEKGDTVDDSSLILRTAKDVDKTTQTNKNNSTENNLEQAQNRTKIYPTTVRRTKY